MRRQHLKSAVIAVGSAGLLASAFMLANSLNPSSRARDLAVAQMDVTALDPGSFVEFQTASFPIFAYRPIHSSWPELKSTESHVRNAQVDSYNEELGVFLVAGVSTFRTAAGACRLHHVAPEDPTFRNLYAFWTGGYFDRCYGAVYDYAGRAINVGLEVDNLAPAHVRNIDGATAEIQLFGS